MRQYVIAKKKKKKNLNFYSCVELANLMVEKKEEEVFILIQLLIFSEKYAFLKLH